MICLAYNSNAIFSQVSYNNETYGYFFDIWFPYETYMEEYLESYALVDNIIINSTSITPYTIIDINDTLYLENSLILNVMIEQLSFLQYFNYLQYEYRFISPMDKLYMWGYNSTFEKKSVTCGAYDLDNDDVYQLLCIPTT